MSCNLFLSEFCLFLWAAALKFDLYDYIYFLAPCFLMSVLCGKSTAMGQGLHTWMFLLYGPFITIVVCVRLVGGWLPDSWTWPHSKLPAPQANISEARCQWCESVQVWLNKVVQFIQEKKMQNKLLNLHYLCHQIKIVLFVYPLLHHRPIAYIWSG